MYKSKITILVIGFVMFSNLFPVVSVSQNVQKKLISNSDRGINKEPEFTNDSTNIVSCKKFDDAKYAILYGKRLENDTEFFKSYNFNSLPKLDGEWKYFYRIIYKWVESGVTKYDTTETTSSFQDDTAPAIDTLRLDGVDISRDTTIFIGKNSNKIIDLTISDLDSFSQFKPNIDNPKDSTDFPKNSEKVETGSGIAKVEIIRTGGNSENAFFLFDSTHIHFDQGYEFLTSLTFQIDSLKTSNQTMEDLLQNQGKYTFDINLTDASYHPAQTTDSTVLGNELNYSFHVVYDTVAPVIDPRLIKGLYTSNDTTVNGTIKLKLVVSDNVAGVDTLSLKYEVTCFKNLTHNWSENLDVLTIEGIPTSDGDCKLKISLKDFSQNEVKTNINFFMDIYPDTLKSFKMYDLDYGKKICFEPDSEYTNSLFIYINTFDPKLSNKDSLIIKGVGSPKLGLIVLYPESDTLKNVDLEQLFPAPLVSGKKYVLSIAAKDSAGNIQSTDIPKDTIIFDDENPGLNSVIISDTTSVEHDDVFVAYKGWTNDTPVNVKINSQDSDLYKLLETSPKKKCFDYKNTFLDTIPDGENKKWPFIFQMCDSAGNESNEIITKIKLDTEIVSLKEQDVTVMDPSSGNTEYTDEDSVIIEFKNLEKFNWNGIPDLSRYVINDSVVFNISDSVLFPVGDGRFTVSVVDFAGNESNSVRDTIKVVRPFRILSVLLQDSSQTGIKPVSGWTNDTAIFVTVEIDTSNGQDIHKVRQLELARDRLFTSGKVVYDLKPEDIISATKVRVVYDSISINQLDSVYARISGPLLEMKSNIVESFIIHDNIKPVLVKTTAHDTSDVTETEYTDQPIVYIETTLADTSLDPYQILITEINPQNQTKRDTLNYSEWILWPLSDGPGRYQFTALIVDSAGNQSSSDSTKSSSDSASIEYRLKIPFAFILIDTSAAPYQADSGFTNDQQVKWRIFASNTVLKKLQKITFYDSTRTNSVQVTFPTSGSLLHIDLLYDNLSSGQKYKIVAEIVLQGDIISDAADPFFVQFDNTRPELREFKISDLYPDKNILYKKLIAKTGWTDSLIIRVHVDAIDNVLLKEVTYFGDTNPGTISYQPDFQLSIKGKNTDTIYCFVSDPAGNRSDTLRQGIKYLSQKITVEIDTLNPLFLDNSAISVNKAIELPVNLSGNFLWQAFTWNDGGDSINYQTPGERLLFPVPNDSGLVHVIIADSSGSMSFKDEIYLYVKNIPVIQLTLFDFSEFPAFQSPTDQLPEDWQRSDSLFTDEMNESKKIVALTRLISGDWDSIRIALRSKENLKNFVYKPVANVNSDIDLREIALPSDVNSLEKITFYVQVKNKAGLTGDTLYTIIHDIRAPVLDSFSGKNAVSDSNYLFSYLGSDKAPGKKAGIVVYESFKEKSRYTYVPAGDENKITLYPERGQRTLTAFLVDKADVDQNRPDSVQARLDRKELDFIDHKSNSISLNIRLNPVEVANFPNPFNPLVQDGYTKLMFPLKQADHVKITILDAFGNLVKSWDAQCDEGLNTGDENPGLRWDGKNGKGQYVANGGYICIIKSNKGEKYIRKIAVAKK